MAILSPSPSAQTIRADGAWHRFTVSANVPVKVIANPTSSTPRVEISTSRPTRNYCPPIRNDSHRRSNRQTVYLAGCVAGTGTVELRRASDNWLLNTYNFRISSAPPTPTPTPRPPAIPTGLTGRGGDSWITLDWNDAPRATSYQVQQWDGRLNPPDWRTLPFRESHRVSEYTIDYNGSGATVYRLNPGVSYAHRVQAVNGRQKSGWSRHITTTVYGGVFGYGDAAGTDPATPPPP